MNSKIKVLIISLKNSPRIFYLTKRLNYLKIKYKISIILVENYQRLRLAVPQVI